MAFINGKAVKFDGIAIDYVMIFDWATGECIDEVVPDVTGNWQYDYLLGATIGVAYIADGCEPIAHGPYELTADPRTPADLFTSLAEGVWYDPSDLSTLFQDAAGTIPVTEGGQPVGLMLDKSGNGHHAKQESDQLKPTYREHGGLAWLDFYGTYLNTSDNVMWDARAFYHCSAVIMQQQPWIGDSSYPYRYLGEFRFLRKGSSTSSNTSNYYEVYTDHDVSTLALVQRYPSTHSYHFSKIPSTAIAKKRITQGLKTANDFEFKVSPYMSEWLQGGGAVSTQGLSTLSIGLGYYGTTERSGMEWYGMIWRVGEISDDEVQLASAYLSAKSGIKL